MRLVDTHCHIHFEEFGIEPTVALETAQLAGVDRLVCVGTSLVDSRSAIKMATEHEGVWASVGSHPHEADAFLATPGSAERLSTLAESPRVVAIGEIGLDFYRLTSSKDDQKKSLRQQIEATLDLNLPYIFHIRDAWADFWPVFDDYPDLTGIVHSFSAGQAQLDEVLARELTVGLNGIMTFTNDEQQLAAAKKVPRERLVLETDAPFLAPKPFRGKISQPMHVRTIAEFLADLRGESLEDLARATTANAERILKI